MRKIKDTRRHFDRISSDLDAAYQKNADAPKTKPQLCEEAERSLHGTTRSFGLAGLEYIRHLNRFYLVRSHSVLDVVSRSSSKQNGIRTYPFMHFVLVKLSLLFPELHVWLEIRLQTPIFFRYRTRSSALLSR